MTSNKVRPSPRDPVEQIIANLRKWRALPGYSVERRIDLLLTPYLEGFLSAEMGAPVELVTAEFPIPKKLFPQLLNGKEPKNQHIAADFLCIRRPRPGSPRPEPAWILVEVKTDVGSKRSIQDLAYAAVCAIARGPHDADCHSTPAPMSQLLGTLRATKAGTKHQREYERLIRRVESCGNGVERIEVCYLQPIVRRPPEANARSASVPRRAVDDRTGVVTWTFGLGALASHISPDDEFGRLLQKVLRGLARSDKARQVKSRGARRGAKRAMKAAL